MTKGRFFEISSTLPNKTENVSILSRSAIFVVRKSYNTQKAQDLVGFVLFCCYILWFAHLAEYLNSGAAFQYFF